MGSFNSRFSLDGGQGIFARKFIFCYNNNYLYHYLYIRAGIRLYKSLYKYDFIHGIYAKF